MTQGPTREVVDSIGESKGASVSSVKRRLRLEAHANLIRERLARRVDALRSRARNLRDPSIEIARHPMTATVVCGAAALAIGAGVGLATVRLSTRRERARMARWDAWARIITHPERVSPARSGFLSTTVKRGLTGVLVAALAAVTKHYVGKLLEGAQTDPESPPYLLRSPDPFPPPRRADSGSR